MSVEMLLVLMSNPHKGAETIKLPGVPRVGDTIRHYNGCLPGPHLHKVMQVVWDADLYDVEVHVKV